MLLNNTSQIYFYVYNIHTPSNLTGTQIVMCLDILLELYYPCKFSFIATSNYWHTRIFMRQTCELRSQWL